MISPGSFPPVAPGTKVARLCVGNAFDSTTISYYGSLGPGTYEYRNGTWRKLDDYVAAIPRTIAREQPKPTLRDQGDVLVMRRALEWSQLETPDDRHLFKITMRAHAANVIMLYTPDYAEKVGDLAANPDLGSYVDTMRKALA